MVDSIPAAYGNGRKPHNRQVGSRRGLVRSYVAQKIGRSDDRDWRHKKRWLGKLTRLNPAAGRGACQGKAPHKPLLLLALTALLRESAE